MLATVEDVKKYKRFTRDTDAQNWLTRQLQDQLNNAQGNKYDRPWHIVNFANILPADADWIGWEFETGFEDEGDYHKCINFLWNAFTYVAIDREGSGKYPFEIAFPPTTTEDLKIGVTPIQQYLSFLKDNNLKQSERPTTFSKTLIGMHINVSTVFSRKNKNLYNVSHSICDTLNAIESADQEKLFGRVQTRFSKCTSRGNYYEFKLFASTDDLDTFAHYTQVALRLVEFVKFVEKGRHNPDVASVTQYLYGNIGIKEIEY